MAEQSPLRILIVDDNEASAKTLGWMMELWGHDIKLAHNGQQGIEVAEEFKPQVIFMDIGLPGMNGYELCSLMQKNPVHANSVFIAQTGWGQSEHRQRSKEAGFAHHLVKPVDMQQLQQLLDTLPVRNNA